MSNEAFEAWARTKFHARDIERDEFGGYVGDNVQGAWEGYQAATERAAKLCEQVGPKNGSLALVTAAFAAAIRAGGEQT